MKILFLINFLNFFLNLSVFNQQSYLLLNAATDHNINIDPRIDNSTEAKIIKEVKSFVSDFFEVSNFKNEVTLEFDQKKYNSFIGFFEGESYVVNDLIQASTSIPYHEYGSLVFNHYSDSGINFSVENIEIKSIGLDDAGFYTAEIHFSKNVKSIIASKGRVRNVNKGLRTYQIMELNMPEYLLSDVRITQIKAKETKLFQSIQQRVSNIQMPNFLSSFKNIFKR